jgi:2-succinyl-5-enolpyruvyl-6-hydroxy-3-cyclohexene-1-carboxylate synthase
LASERGELPTGRCFEADPAAVYAYADCFFASLAAAGVAHVVISPGSRSTPLAIAAERCPALRTWIELDERAAGFFALGLAKASRVPAALICTSGTAAANYLPAVVEAHHARVPLLVLTADRPSELRDFGAGQTIDQTGLYGRHPRWSVEVPIPEAGEGALRHAEILAARAVERAVGRPAGAVHLNWPLREPLAPPARDVQAVEAPALAPLRFTRARPVADPADVDELVALALRCERGVVCAGPMDADDRLAAALARFAARAGWPLFADPASQLRRGPWLPEAAVLDGGDLLARAPGFAAQHAPEVLVRIGDPPVSKAQRLWLEASAPASVWWLDEGGQWGEPSRQATRVVVGGAASLLEAAAAKLPETLAASRSWGRDFVAANERGRAALAAEVAGATAVSGLGLAFAVAEAAPAGGQLFASNSMPIRLLDLALACRREPLRVFCNRGASGIDGISSTALGVAAATGIPTLLLTGDLAFLHDLTGLLLARREAIPLVLAVLDDGGGGIFSFLPIAEQGEAVAFDRLFRTPHGLDLARAAALFELDYERVDAPAALPKALEAALARPRVSIVHVRVDPTGNTRAFRQALACAASAIDATDASAAPKVGANPGVDRVTGSARRGRGVP